jgi:hypothetical protein
LSVLILTCRGALVPDFEKVEQRMVLGLVLDPKISLEGYTRTRSRGDATARLRDIKAAESL